MMKVIFYFQSMANNRTDEYKLPASVLLVLGMIDLIRGFLHTFAVNWAATTFAKLDLSYARNDQLWLLGVFGISNILTGLIYILISRKAKNLSPYVLGIIPVAYLLGIVGLRTSEITPTAEFDGKYFMLVYFGICIITLGIYLIRKYQKK